MAPLLRQAIDDRALGFDHEQRLRPGSMERSLAFAGHAQRIATGHTQRIAADSPWFPTGLRSSP